MVLSLFVVVLLLFVVVLASLVADFLLPFYYLVISSSRLFTVLTASMSPIPKQKPTIPRPIEDPITSDFLEVNKFLVVSAPLGGCGAFIVSSCLFSIFITLR